MIYLLLYMLGGILFALISHRTEWIPNAENAVFGGLIWPVVLVYSGLVRLVEHNYKA